MTELDVMLDAALDAVKAGDFAALADFDPQIEALVGVDEATLARLRTKATRLSHYLEAAGKGIRAARWRVAEIGVMARDGDRLVTYDGKGRRSAGGPSGMVQRF